MNYYPELVTVGIPVYNGAATIARTLQAILDQSHPNIEIVISDNCSTDQTAEICASFDNRYQNIRYLRQQQHCGACANFEAVVEASTGEYFMWAAADDHWGTRFVELTLHELRENADLIGVSVAPYLCPNVASVKLGYFGIEEETSTARLEGLVRALPDGNARFYSLYRTRALRGARFSAMDHLAWDWIAMLHIVAQGKVRVMYNPEQGFVKNEGGESMRPRHVLSKCKGLKDIARPLRHYTAAIPDEVRSRQWRKLLMLELGFTLRALRDLALLAVAPKADT